MRLSTSRGSLAIAGATIITSTLAVAGLASPAEARPAVERPGCVETDVQASSTARGGFADKDHREVTAKEQRRIERATARIIRTKGTTMNAAGGATATVPVYFHVMRDAAGNGDVTNKQITQQMAVLNRTFAGGESSAAANTGFAFTLAGVDRFNNNQWHQDKSSTTYRKATRLGGANALNIWLVDFKYLGIATFPWDYAKSPGIDGIRVHYASLPGGTIANYDLGETATHEAGHWFGLYHTFQGGCTATNDEVEDTPAQAGPTTGCPEGQDTCPAPGTDPIHNYMDYSYDTCYTQFSLGQSTRAGQMWTAYRS
jgi:Pregnancy-associated plasma protein-A